IVDREVGPGVRGRATRGHAVDGRDRTWKDAYAIFRHADLTRVLQLDRAGDHADRCFRGVAQVLVAVQVQRIAGLDDEGFTDRVGRVGEQDLGAARGRDVHAGGNHVEAPGFQRRNQRAEFGENSL